MLECKHELKHNKDTDWVFCTLCGKKWENKIEYISVPEPSPNFNPPVTFGDNTSAKCPYCFLPFGQCKGHNIS